MSWNDSSVIGSSLYDGNCDAKVIIGMADMSRIWTPDVYIYNTIDTVCGICLSTLLYKLVNQYQGLHWFIKAKTIVNNMARILHCLDRCIDLQPPGETILRQG